MSRAYFFARTVYNINAKIPEEGAAEELGLSGNALR